MPETANTWDHGGFIQAEMLSVVQHGRRYNSTTPPLARVTWRWSTAQPLPSKVIAARFSPYLDILTEHYRFLYVYGILNQNTTKIDQIRNKDIADFTR